MTLRSRSRRRRQWHHGLRCCADAGGGALVTVGGGSRLRARIVCGLEEVSRVGIDVVTGIVLGASQRHQERSTFAQGAAQGATRGSAFVTVGGGSRLRARIVDLVLEEVAR